MLTSVPLPSSHELTPRARELAYPRLPALLRAVNRRGRADGERAWPLDPGDLADRARARARLPHAQVPAGVQAPLDVLCRSLREDVELNPNGRRELTQQLVSTVAHRLRLDDVITRRPEIFELPVTQPLFVTGVMRSGTTFLQKLLSVDPSSRSLPLWEVVRPFPAGDLAARGPHPPTANRIWASRVECRILRALLPEQDDMHPLRAEEPEEEELLLALGQCTSMYENMLILPGYGSWFRAADHREGYLTFRRLLQYLQWSRHAGERWVLKAPGHLEMLLPLFAAFPDATVLHTHRDPTTAVVSFSSLMTYGARVYVDHPNPHAIGAFVTDFVERILRADLRDRAVVDGRLVDVFFSELIADPVREVRRIYAAIGRQLDPVTERAALDVVGRQARRTGRHHYAPEDYGLTVAGLRERFAFYYEHFDVPFEAA